MLITIVYSEQFTDNAKSLSGAIKQIDSLQKYLERQKGKGL